MQTHRMTVSLNMPLLNMVVLVVSSILAPQILRSEIVLYVTARMREYISITAHRKFQVADLKKIEDMG